MTVIYHPPRLSSRQRRILVYVRDNPGLTKYRALNDTSHNRTRASNYKPVDRLIEHGLIMAERTRHGYRLHITLRGYRYFEENP